MVWRTAVPTYEYRCAANGRVIEVQHKMAERLASWGELCERAGISRGRTDPRAPVEKLMSVGFIGTGGRDAAREAPACDAPDCGSAPCGGGFCASEDF